MKYSNISESCTTDQYWKDPRLKLGAWQTRLGSFVVSCRLSRQFLGFYLKLGQTAFWQTYSFLSITDCQNIRRYMV
jgi:hypothetical protein